MGYVQDMKRNFSVWSVLGVGFSLTNSWFGISTALVTGINSGGPVLIIYGIILITFVSASVGISLAELASAMPNAGGQYFWAYELAHPKFAKFASYLTGWFAWAGSIFTSASVALGLGSAVMGCVQLFRPEMFVSSPFTSLILRIMTRAQDNPTLAHPPRLRKCWGGETLSYLQLTFS
jgi:choline transport protein